MAATPLRVVTWNIRAAIGTGPFPDRWWCRIDAARLRAIGDFLASLDRDVLALQEVALASRSGDLVDNAGDLARQLGMEVRYAAVRTFAIADGHDRNGAGMFGCALLSRHPMRSVRVIALPAAPDDAFIEPPGAAHSAAGVRYSDAPSSIREPRSLLVAEVQGVTVGTAHFSNVGSAERLLQATATVSAFGDATPAVLLGDLNAPIEATELAPLAAWVDGFAEPPGDSARASTDDGHPIDQVLVRGATVLGCTVLREAGELSDHFPIAAELRPLPI